MDLPLDIVVEATGEPEVAAANAAAALDHGKHVAMVSKEADCVVGPILDQKARAAGLVHTPVDGDQPALLIRLVAWARGLGLEIVAAGKSSEYDFVLDPSTETVTVRGQRVEAKGFGRLWTLAPGAIEATLRARAAALAALPQRTAPDFCEMAIVTNNTGLRPDTPAFHAPILRTLEVPGVFCPKGHGGLLGRPGAIDVFNCLRRPDEASFAGGVFVVVRCRHAPTWALLRGKGIPLSADGAHALIYHPSHLLGVEAPNSIVAAVRQGRSSAGAEVRPVSDLVGRATSALPAGSVLALGERHTIAGLEPLLVDAGPAGDPGPLPYYMAAGRTLSREVPAGAVVTRAMVDPPGESALWRLRAEQDRMFHA
jgi:predicted homoserine dehydrogenase-like protein